MFLWDYYDVLIKVALWITTGSYHGYDQWVAGISPQRYHASKGTVSCHPPAAPVSSNTNASILQ